MSQTPEHDPSAALPDAAPHHGQPEAPTLPTTPQQAREQSLSPAPAVPQTPVEQPVSHQLPQAPMMQSYAAPTPPMAEQSGNAQVTHEQPTVPQPEFGQAQYGHPEFSQQTPQQSTFEQQTSGPSKSRAGVLLTGLAIGALLGGVVGGGVSAIVASNISTPSNTVQGGGTLTLNNSETSTAISGVAAVATPSVVTLEVSNGTASGSGSGVIYSEDGYIITNAHVVTLDGAASTGADVRVKMSDGQILAGAVVGVDPYADLAVVKVEASNLPAVAVADSSKLNVGDLTVAIGAPMNLSNTVTSGVVSAVDRGISVGSPLIPQDPSQQPRDENGGEFGFPWDFRFGPPTQDPEQAPQQASGGTVTLPVIQTDASINPGNSGGALLNAKGELIGINVAIASPTSSNGTASSAGLGFAIPSNLATRVADAIIAGEQPSHGLLGATVGDSSLDAAANRAGGLIIDLVPGGAAEQAGLKSGDVITAVNGVPAADGTSVSALVRMHAGGSEITVEYTRNGEPGKATVTLGNLEW